LKQRLVIHIGIEKTGTTSLQEYLYLNEAVLASCGIGLLHSVGKPNNRLLARYADPRDKHKIPPAWGSEALPDGVSWREVLLRRVQEEIRALPLSTHTVVVSSEHLHSRLRSEDDVRCLAELFDGLFERVDVVVYLRRQDRLAVSLYSTALRVGWATGDVLPKLDPQHSHYYNFAKFLDRWARVFGEDRMTVRVFDRARFVDGDLYADFLHACRWPELREKMTVPPPQNEALSAVGAAALLALNRALASFIDAGELHVGQQLRCAMAESLTQRYPGGGATITRAEAEAFLAGFESSNLEVCQRWFGGEAIFDGHFSNYPEVQADVSFPAEVLTTVAETVVQYIKTVEAKKRVSSAPRPEPLR
jgi:hypothetical protein